MSARSSPWKKHDLFPALLRNCMSWQQHEHVGQAGRVRLRDAVNLNSSNYRAVLVVLEPLWLLRAGHVSFSSNLVV